MSDFKLSDFNLKKASAGKLKPEQRDKLKARLAINAASDTSPETRTLALECARAALEKKAENLKILDVSQSSGFTDYFVICSAHSDRQIRAIMDSIETHIRNLGRKPLSLEGAQEARWVLLDYGEIVVHVFHDSVRDYYNLEGLWAQAPGVSVPTEFYPAAAERS